MGQFLSTPYRQKFETVLQANEATVQDLPKWGKQTYAEANSGLIETRQV